jgi:MHS family proline/betaine transporter-like MFS transporter
MFAGHARTLLQVVGLAIFPNVAFYLAFTYLQTHLSHELGFPPTNAALSTLLSVAVAMVLVPPLGLLSDHVGRKPMLIVACIGYAVLTYPALWMMQHGTLTVVVLAHTTLGGILAIYLSALTALLAELLPTQVRYSGFAIGHNMAVALFGGIAPFLATALIAVTGDPIAPGTYQIAAAIATLLALTTVRETSRGLS